MIRVVLVSKRVVAREVILNEDLLFGSAFYATHHRATVVGGAGNVCNALRLKLTLYGCTAHLWWAGSSRGLTKLNFILLPWFQTGLMIS